MSTSETDSDSEHELTTDSVPSLTAFAHLSATRPSQGSTEQRTVNWAVDTLTTLDFRLVRKDTTLHGLVHNCASTILAFLNTVLEQDQATPYVSDFIPDVTSILRPSFLHLLFQYRRLFRIIATKDFQPNPAPMAIVCWVDVILAKLGDLVAFIAVGMNRDHLLQSLPESLQTQREEDNLRAAIQLSDNWDMLSSMLLSERVSVAAKRLSLRLLLGGYVFCPALSGKASVDNTIHRLLSSFSEFVRQSALRVGELRSVSGPHLQFLVQQERLMGAMIITLFASAEMAQDSASDADHTVAFRPQTMAAAIQLLRFVLNKEAYFAPTDILSPLNRLDIPSNVIMRWGIVPQWAWSIWLEYRNLYADTILCLTMGYIQHHFTGPGTLEISDLMASKSNDQSAVISVMLDLVFRFILMFSTGEHPKRLSTDLMNVLHGICRLISQWINQNSCGIQNSTDCCKALILLFGCLCQHEQHGVLGDLIIESLALMREQCTREAWKAAAEDSEFRFLEGLSQSFTRTKTELSQSDPRKSSEIHAVQLMQFLVVMMSKRVKQSDQSTSVECMQAIGSRVLEMPPDEGEFLCETFLLCLAAAKMCGINPPFDKAADEAIWRVGTCSRDVNLFLASAFSLYIASTCVAVEPLTYLEGLEHLLDMVLLICTRQYPREDEQFALIVLPTICDALVHLLEHKGNTTAEVYAWADIKLSALGNVLRSLGNGEGQDSLLEHRLWSTTRRVLQEVCGERVDVSDKEGEQKEYQVVICRRGEKSHVVYVKV